MNKDFTISQHGTGDGVLVTGEGSQPLGQLTKSWVLQELAKAGYLVFRGFDPTLEQFSELVRSVCSRTTQDPARAFVEGSTVQLVDLGTDEVGLHVEHGTNPLTPHLSWFMCVTAAKVGSQTTVCDGYRVWDQLSPSTRDLFSGQDIVYSRNVSEPAWRALAGGLLNGAKSENEITVQDLQELSRMFGENRMQIDPNEDGSIHYNYRVPAVHPTLFGERPAFANSILGPSYHYEKPRIALADGQDIPAEVIDEIRKTTDELIEDIDWVDGDIVVVDNTRVMHGRRKIEDPDRRKICVAIGYLDQ